MSLKVFSIVVNRPMTMRKSVRMPMRPAVPERELAMKLLSSCTISGVAGVASAATSAGLAMRVRSASPALSYCATCGAMKLMTRFRPWAASAGSRLPRAKPEMRTAMATSGPRASSEL